MCGIAGYISKKNLLKENNVKATLNLMRNRGPDSKGSFVKTFNDKELGLLHSRLNIIDLNNRSDQPFHADGIYLIFNGEIYNYIELKNTLKKKYNFKTNSDTEVLLRSYQEYGSKCVDHFVGMWAFAIWDSNKNILFLSRDPFGEKPLYYHYNSEGFFFGSEIKYIKSLCKKTFQINKCQINKNLFLGYKSLNKTDLTFFNEIKSLENSTNIFIDLNLRKKKQKYWKPKLNINRKLNNHEVSENVKNLLVKSLKLRMRSDVPLAFCLSGGIDSSLLVSHAKKTLGKEISTFSIIDNNINYDETKNIDLLKEDLKCKINKINLNNNSEFFFDRLEKLTNYHDGPIAVISYYLHSFLSEAISKQNFKVAVSGTGADEIFTGYYDHFLLHLKEMNGTNNFNSSLDAWKKYIKPKIRNPIYQKSDLYINDPNNRTAVYESNFNLIKYSQNYDEEKFFEQNYSRELLRNRMLNELFNEVVPVILKHDDLNSMYYSIENRSPYLDRDLLEYSLTIPPNLLIDDGFQKKILRDSAKNILVDDIRLDRQKRGFNASISSLLDFSDKSVVDNIFDKNSNVNEYVNLEKLKKDIDFKNIPNHISKFIFSIISTNIFLKSDILK